MYISLNHPNPAAVCRRNHGAGAWPWNGGLLAERSMDVLQSTSFFNFI